MRRMILNTVDTLRDGLYFYVRFTQLAGTRSGASQGKVYVIRSGNPLLKADSARAPHTLWSKTSPHFYEVASTGMSCAIHFENVYREGIM